MRRSNTWARRGKGGYPPSEGQSPRPTTHPCRAPSPHYVVPHPHPVVLNPPKMAQKGIKVAKKFLAQKSSILCTIPPFPPFWSPKFSPTPWSENLSTPHPTPRQPNSYPFLQPTTVPKYAGSTYALDPYPQLNFNDA